MSKRVSNTYPLATVMSYAVMANAINNGEYIKQTVEKPVEVCGQPTKWVVDTYSNKEIMNVAMDTGFL